MTSFALATVQTATGLEAALVVDKKLYLLSEFDSPIQKKSVKQLLQDWPTNFSILQNLASQASPAKALNPKDVTLATPIHLPNKLLAVGANYTSHLKEMGLPTEKWHPMPFFSCPPSTSIVGPGKTIHYPATSKQFDWECELTVVIGKHLRNASVQEAADAIVGYTIGLDLSCRDLLVGPKGMMDIMRGKAQDGMKPCGPYFVPKECVKGDANDLAVKLWVNGDLMIDGSTSEMIFKPEEALAEISSLVTLEPGDMVMTGTPAGSAKSHGERWLKVGDKIKAAIGDLEPLELEIVE